jgi:Tfp pilus assembly protein PilF
MLRPLVATSTLALLVAACGGASPPPKLTEGPLPGAPAQPGATAEQPGAPAPAPTTGSPDAPPPAPAVEAPRMNAAAAQSYARGAVAFQAGDLAAAKAAFTDATKADPKAYQAFHALGVVQERLGDASCVSSYKAAYAIVPDWAPAIAAHALYLARKGNPSEAESLLAAKRKELPSSAGVIAALAEIKSMQRDTGSAQQLAQEALKKDSDYRPAMVTLARDHYRNRRLDLALYALVAILDGFGENNPPRDKDNADAHYLRGLIQKEEGLRGPAMDAFKRAVALRPDMVEARVELASFYLEAGNATDALPLLEGALRFDPGHVVANLMVGDCYRLQGRFEEARQRFDWVAQKDAALPQVHYDLGLLYLFAPTLQGMDPKKQLDAAVAEIGKYQSMRGKAVAAGQSDDSEELLNRAKSKLADLQAQAQAREMAPPGGDSAGGAPDGG